MMILNPASFLMIFEPLLRRNMNIQIADTSGKILFENAEIAKTFFKRLCGLMFCPGVSNDYALIFYNAPAIHMCFMRIPLDIIFCDENLNVIKICESILPWGMVVARGAHCTIECAAGSCRLKNIYIGKRLSFTKPALCERVI